MQQLKWEEKRQVDKQSRLEWLIQATKGTIKSGDKGWGAVKDPSRLIRRWRTDEELKRRRKADFRAIRLSAQRVGFSEEEAIRLVDKIRDELPMNRKYETSVAVLVSFLSCRLLFL